VAIDAALAEAHGSLALMLVSAWDTPGAIKAARRAVALEPANWRHLFRLGHATWGDERLRAGAATLALYPDFAFAYFQSAMVHVARGHLTDAERVLRHGAAIQDRQIGRGERYPALGLHWLLGLVRLAQDDTHEAIEEFERERALAEAHRLYGREYSMHAALAHGAALLRLDRGRAADQFRHALALYPGHPLAQAGLSSVLGEPAPRLSSGDAVTRGLLLATRGEHDGAAAALLEALAEAPPGFAGWFLPVDPFITQLTDSKAFTSVFAKLVERAR
jgi:tetratricopeptide (TPR) repeat protein